MAMEATVNGSDPFPAKRLSKEELLKLHNARLDKQQASAQENGNTPRVVKRPDVGHPYPASTKPIRELEKIPLRSLQPEIHHWGQAVIVRTIALPYSGAGTTTVVEDEHGDVAKLVVYAQSDSSILSNIPEGCIVAVKEPFFKSAGPGAENLLISVDHPSDILLLRFSDPVIPEALKGSTGPLFASLGDWKTAGDASFLQHDLATAVFCYTEALDFTSEKTDLTIAVLAKRAGTNLLLGRYDAAREDALASLTGGPADWKAYLTASKAAYALGDFNSALILLESALKTISDSAVLKKEWARTTARIHEEKTGEYDFPSLAATVSRANVYLDVGSFTRRAVAQLSEKHGRGLFAKEDIKVGEIIFVEKATVMPNQYEDEKTSAALYAALIRRTYDNPTLARRLATLWADDSYDHLTVPVEGGEGDVIVDGVPVVDVFRTELARVKNCFSSPLSTLENTYQKEEGAFAKGIWPYAAYMNHACVANSTRAFVGDVLIARATRDIAAGEEITQQYVPIKANREARKAQFQNWWGFECQCGLCAGEAASTAESYEKMKELLAQIEKIANKTARSRERRNGCGHRGTQHLPDATIRNVERLTRQLEEAHEEAVFGTAEYGLPRLMLVFPTMWLVDAYRGRKNHAKVVTGVVKALRNFGFVVPKGKTTPRDTDPDANGAQRKAAQQTTNGVNTKTNGHSSGGAELVSNARIFQEQPHWAKGLMSIHAVRVLKHGADAYRALGQEENARQWEESARFGYMLITGWENNDLERMSRGE